MAGSVNRVTLLGNVGKDPEVRSTQNGDKIVSFNLATSESWKDKSGQRKEKTEWHKVVIFNKTLAGIAEQYVKKGSRVYLEGTIQTRKWTDKDGAERYTTEIVLPQFRGDLTLLDAPTARRDEPGDVETYVGGIRQPARRGNDLNDEIPF